MCEPGFVAGIADTGHLGPPHFAKYYFHLLTQIAHEEEVPPTHFKKPENLTVPSEEQVFTDLRKRPNFKRTGWTSPLEDQVDYHLQTDMSCGPTTHPSVFISTERTCASSLG